MTLSIVMDQLHLLSFLCVDLLSMQSTITSIIVYRNSKSGHSVATIHGAVLALTASVLSVPYDMPRYSLCYLLYMHGSCQMLIKEAGVPCLVCVDDPVDLNYIYPIILSSNYLSLDWTCGFVAFAAGFLLMSRYSLASSASLPP